MLRGRALPETNEQRGIIRVRSMIFAPKILPRPKLVCFLTTEVTVVTSSGRDVPMATMVAEIRASEIPKCRAISLLESTRRSEPKTIPAVPKTNLMIFLFHV